LPGLVVKEALQLIRATLPPQIVKSYGGYITCKSKLGKGSVFNINLPAIAQYNEKEDIVRDDVSLNGCERLLFVDDEEMLGKMAKTILEKLGYDVSIRSCPIEALKLFEKQPKMFDMLITDPSMPGMDGIELTKKMLAIRSDLPVMPVYWEQ
jgi:PleD family two-component response regulator